MTPRKKEEQPTETGTQILRHQRRDLSDQSVDCDGDAMDLITDHFERNIGPIEIVFHEIRSIGVHIDVHHIAPTKNHPYHTLFTTGMSYRPMSVPSGAEEYRFAEMMVHLPPAWPVQYEAFKDEANYWPIRSLKSLARLPHECDTWLYYGHTIRNGDPPEPFAHDTRFCCNWIVQPLLLPPEAHRLRAAPDRLIHFLSLVPIYREEMDHKLIKGFAGLQEAFETADMPLSQVFIIDNQRPNVSAQSKSQLPLQRK